MENMTHDGTVSANSCQHCIISIPHQKFHLVLMFRYLHIRIMETTNYTVPLPTLYTTFAMISSIFIYYHMCVLNKQYGLIYRQSGTFNGNS